MQVKLFRELEEFGWACVPGIYSRSKLLELARSLGRPIASPSGELVKELVPKSREKARRGTLSETHDVGPFPLHTDTAFWPVPSRFLVLRAHGDIRRCTTVLSFADLFREAASEECDLAERSVWLVHASSRKFYCSMKFRARNVIGWRYDEQCMNPVNEAACKTKEMLGPRLTHSGIECIHWTDDLALVLSNWKVLHGRGPSPPDENCRILDRVCVE
jgi:hypothetical protein